MPGSFQAVTRSVQTEDTGRQRVRNEANRWVPDSGPPEMEKADMYERLKKAREHEDGFTLIELLVVIVILGILAAVVVFAVGGVGDKGQSSACVIDTRTIRTAEEANLANKGTYDTEANLVANGLLSQQSTLHDITGATTTAFTITEQDRGDGKSSCTVPAGGAAGGTVNGTTNL